MFSHEDEDSNMSVASLTQDGRPKRQRNDITKQFCLVYFLDDDWCSIDVATKFFPNVKNIDDLCNDIQTTIKIYWPEDGLYYDGRLLASSRNRLELVEFENEFKKSCSVDGLKVTIPGLKGMPGRGHEYVEENTTTIAPTTSTAPSRRAPPSVTPASSTVTSASQQSASSNLGRKRRMTQPADVQQTDPNNILQLLSRRNANEPPTMPGRHQARVNTSIPTNQPTPNANAGERRTLRGLPFKEVADQLLTEIYPHSYCYIDKSQRNILVGQIQQEIYDLKNGKQTDVDLKEIGQLHNKFARNMIEEFFGEDLFIYTAKGNGENLAAPLPVLRAIEAYVNEKFGPLTKKMARIYADLKRDRTAKKKRQAKEGRFAPGYTKKPRKKSNSANGAAVTETERNVQPLTGSNNPSQGVSGLSSQLAVDPQNAPINVAANRRPIAESSLTNVSINNGPNQSTGSLPLYAASAPRSLSNRGSRRFSGAPIRVNSAPHVEKPYIPNGDFHSNPIGTTGISPYNSANSPLSYGFQATSAMQMLSSFTDDDME